MEEQYQVIIVGAGLSGLAAAHFLARSQGAPERVLLLEKEERAGGAIESFQEAGYQAEWGPHGFLDNNPESRELLAATGLEAEALKAPLGRNVRYVCHHGRLMALPQSPLALLRTPLLTPGGKLRLLGDLYKKPLADGHSVGQWAAYRFGPQVLPLVDAAVTGTYAGDFQRLSIDAVMPGARRLEKTYGSLLRGLLKERKRKGAVPPAAGEQAPKRLPAMTTFPGGMPRLVQRLREEREIVYNCPVTTLKPLADGGWELVTPQRIYRCRQLLLALPVNRALALLDQFAPPLTAIPEARILTVALGFRQQDAQIPVGFGYLAPERENRFTLGALFSSQMFPQRAPAGHHLLEALVGGRRHPERLDLDDETIIREIHRDLRQLLPISAPPVFSRVLRSPAGIPQLEENHLKLLDWREQLQEDHPSLQITGFGWDGIGMNDMMKAAKQAVERLQRSHREQEEAAVRPVYF